MTGKTEVRVLDDIFVIMQNLYNKMHLSENGNGNHLDVFDEFAKLGKTLVGADRVSFWRWDKGNKKLATTVAMGVDKIVMDEGTGIVGRALAENRPIVTDNPQAEPGFNADIDAKTGYKTKSVLVMPVKNCRGETIGAFQAINKLDGDGFDEKEDVKRLSIAAFICGMALESDIFLDESQHDKLTGLKNRFGFYADCKSKYAKAMQANENNSLSLIICDIDFFKKVNDNYGHNGGDAVLKFAANILREKAAPFDVYRWGGEEFLLLLGGKNIDFAAKKAEEIRIGIENSVCHFEEKAVKHDITITMSFGCAEARADLTMEENVNVADHRLYQAKETGRNKVVATGEPSKN